VETFAPFSTMHAVTVAAIGLATAMLVLLAVAFGALALLVGAIAGSRGLAMGVTTSVAFASYLVDVYAPVSEPLEQIQALSPFYYYDAAEPLRNGLAPAHLAFLVVVTALLAAFALVAFERRDVTV